MKTSGMLSVGILLITAITIAAAETPDPTEPPQPPRLALAPDDPEPDTEHTAQVVEEDWPTLTLSAKTALVETNRTNTVFGLKPAGIVLDAVVSKKPLEFINPRAPAEAGYGEAYLVRDPMTERPVGLKLLSFDFECSRRK